MTTLMVALFIFVYHFSAFACSKHHFKRLHVQKPVFSGYAWTFKNHFNLPFVHLKPQKDNLQFVLNLTTLVRLHVQKPL